MKLTSFSIIFIEFRKDLLLMVQIILIRALEIQNIKRNITRSLRPMTKIERDVLEKMTIKNSLKNIYN